MRKAATIKLLPILFFVVLFGGVGCEQQSWNGESGLKILPFSDVFNQKNPQPGLSEVQLQILESEARGGGRALPIVFVPGFFGTKDYDFFGVYQLSYWNRVDEMMEAAGFSDVYFANIDAANYSTDGPLTQSAQFLEDSSQNAEDWKGIVDPLEQPVPGRSSQLAVEIGRILENYPGDTKINIVAHSQGALTSRWFITHHDLGDRVNALVTLSGANRGVDLTRLAFEKDLNPSIEQRIHDIEIPQPVADTILEVIGEFSAFVTNSENTSCKGAMIEMYPPYTQGVFNKYCPDRPGVTYFSIAARMMELDELASPSVTSSLWGIHLLYNLMEWGPNDGTISVESMKGPVFNLEDGELGSQWIYLGEAVGRPSAVVDALTLGTVQLYPGLDHEFYRNPPLNPCSDVVDLQGFYRDLGRLLRAYSE